MSIDKSAIIQSYEEFYMDWAQLLKNLRNKLLLSQTEMAELLGVSFASINRWENNHHEPTIKVKRQIKELCKKHKVDFDSYME